MVAWPSSSFVLIAAQHGLDPGREHARAEGLGHVVVGAELETGDDVGFAALGGQHDDRDLLGLGVGLELAADLETVDARQHEVEQHEVGQLETGRAQGVFTRLDADHAVAFLGQVVLDQLEDLALVVDDEDGFLGHRTPRYGCRATPLGQYSPDNVRTS